MNSTISSPKKILVAFMEATHLGERCTYVECANHSPAEKPKVWENFRWTGLGQRT